ncbi:unnamed protein product [Darwinula stevensoni]|uniref:Coiled-coil domain-containing protein 186 n=1 Tax=Darwinula stevensoni TaxID=69355 RepID=A0A7R8ZYA1_9CRUS|nr:unnamed protein product [Darwinula stevensoni]CAG0880028.1 unnamed protein product [Darwinula stevensoni]
MASLSSLMSEEIQVVNEAVTSEPLADKPLGVFAEIPNMCTYRQNENAVLFISGQNAGECEASASGIQLDGPVSLSSHSSYTQSQISLDDLGSNEDLHHLSLSNYGPKSMEELNRLIMDSPDDDDSDSHSSLNLGVESINCLKQRIRSGEDKICEMEETISNLRSTTSDMQKELRDFEKCKQDLDTSKKNCKNLEEKVDKLQRMMEELRQTKEREFTSAKRDWENQFEMLRKQKQAADKDKEMMVMRYAQSEQMVIVVRNEKENLDKRMREMFKEREGLNNRIKILSADKVKLGNNLDAKCSEACQLVKEIEQLKEEINSRDIKIKWGQNKLKSEIENHKETQGKFEKALRQIQETREEAEQIRRDCQNMLRNYKESEQNQQKADQEREEEAQALIKAHADLEAVRKRQEETLDENNSLTIKVHQMERDRLEAEQQIGNLRETISQLRQEISEWKDKASSIDELHMKLQKEKEKVVQLQGEMEQIRQENNDLQTDMVVCRQKEAELLEFTAKLTEKNVCLQSEFRCLEAKSNHLEQENKAHVRHMEELEREVDSLRRDVEAVKAEKEKVEKEKEEMHQEGEKLQQKLMEAKDEIRVMKKRHSSSLKDLSRELQGTQQRLKAIERGRLPHPCLQNGYMESDRIPRASRDKNGPVSGKDTTSSGEARKSHSGDRNVQIALPAKAQPSEGDPNGIEGGENQLPSTQLLIERIVKLQQALARRKEKIEILEEHRRHLIRDLRKKSQIIQHYVEMMSKRGIMASLYRSRQADGTMTLDLSLEINHKLQTVLEDTLLKNMTLKENLNTLGNEIARLTQEKQEQLKKGIST